MLGDKKAVATVSVRDLAVARKFYEDTLGLKVASTAGAEAFTVDSGGSQIIVYRSQFAGSNKATAINWIVGADIEKIVEGLKGKGIAFEHYDMPGATHKGDVHVFGYLKSAWFKDPDGNILALMNS
jgi:catechol 2,3-dioxygenase-like lactoylglutathione lyase family enzyme